MKKNNKQRLAAGILAIVLVIAMVVPMALSFLI